MKNHFRPLPSLQIATHRRGHPSATPIASPGNGLPASTPRHRLVAPALPALALTLALATGSASAVTNFTETFNTDASNWLNNASGAPAYFATGGIGDSGYISYTAPDFNSGTGGFGDPLQLMFRGNNAANASGDAFVGNWMADGVLTLSLAVRHNYGSSLNFYTRIAGVGGAGASLANIASYAIAPNVWTTITIPITDSNPPFASYGPSTFNGTFTNVQNLQFGLYLPASTDFSNLRMDLDNVAVAVPEPSTAISLIGGLGLLLLHRRRRLNG